MQPQSPAPRGKRELLRYVLLLFLAAFLICSVLMMHYAGRLEKQVEGLGGQITQLRSSMDESIAGLEAEKEQLQQQLSHMERRAMAADLLALAHDAQTRGDRVAFHSYMAVLEAYADALQGESAALYARLEEEL